MLFKLCMTKACVVDQIKPFVCALLIDSIQLVDAF